MEYHSVEQRIKTWFPQRQLRWNNNGIHYYHRCTLYINIVEQEINNIIKRKMKSWLILLILSSANPREHFPRTIQTKAQFCQTNRPARHSNTTSDLEIGGRRHKNPLSNLQMDFRGLVPNRTVYTQLSVNKSQTHAKGQT